MHSTTMVKLKRNQDIDPKPIHSHNDYWRENPVFDAVNAGCLSIEADTRLQDDGTLVLSHDGNDSLDFKEVYVKRLLHIVDHFSIGARGPTGPDDEFVGLYTRDTGLSVVLSIDVKTDAVKTLEAVMAAFEPLRKRNLLSHYDEAQDDKVARGFGQNRVIRPAPNPWTIPRAQLPQCGIQLSVFTVVFTGNTDIRYLKDHPQRHYFADYKIPKAVWRGLPDDTKDLSPQLFPTASCAFNDLDSAIEGGDLRVPGKVLHYYRDRGISTRIWGAPEWPIRRRQTIWDTLYDGGVDWLNTDDLEAAARY